MTAIASANAVAEIAALIGDPARANILSALMTGRALAAGELACAAGVSPQTTSGHLAKLTEARLLSVEQQGRHRYYRLASPDIARAVEALMTVAAAGVPRHRPAGPKDEALRTARSCYDHIAGRLGVALAASLCRNGRILLADGAGAITEDGWRFFAAFGIDPGADPRSRRPLCRPCLDWSERRPHLAGRLGLALLSRSLELGWVVPVSDSRALRITGAGHRGFVGRFGLSPDWPQGREGAQEF
ncbi:MAG: metalloregulator ArsR/SmtB family transcription factor [Azospirillum sp.]|nr:metalloregulator ArsR/SmtB family transcription factor [Azospirillum sp.]